jgi:phage-related protein
MAVAPTGAIYKAMTIDGESSRTYGVYITGQAVYNAPQREVEMISIAGRNGKFALDKGRFENIEVTYPAGIYADTEEDFAEAVSNFRNYLCSRDGYVRIEDEYNPNEYRMGVYKSGLEVTPKLLKAGEFDITFDCKPQRWLKSGENAITVASGDVVTNPTLFESSPMLEVEGYGTVEFNGYDIELENAAVGRVVLAPAGTGSMGSIQQINYANSGLINAGDVVTYGDIYIPFAFTTAKSGAYMIAHSVTYEVVSGSMTITDETTSSRQLEIRAAIPGGTFENPSSGTVIVASADVHVSGRARINSTTTGPFELDFSVRIVAGKSYIQMGRFNTVDSADIFRTLQRSGFTYGEISAESTQNLLGHPTYIDCDLGEVYKIEDGKYASLNSYVDLGSDLPKLSSGANTITFDNTITDLKIDPRWWKV